MTILYLTFYFTPDLCAGSFRNTPVVAELADQLTADDVIHVLTTQPNRYQSFRQTAPDHEQRVGRDGCRVEIDRVAVPSHANGLSDQIRLFVQYYRAAHRLTRKRDYDLVVASSSRLFTAFLGARFARRQRTPLVLDIRDLFRETILEMFEKRRLVRWGLWPVLWAVERYTFGYARHINLVSEGFRSYFARYQRATYSYFTNGIDDEFLRYSDGTATVSYPKTLLYAGNIGEGQGLHKIIPQAARRLGDEYRFVVIGDGGARVKLAEAIRAEGVQNVELRLPISRRELIAEYQSADYLFVHLNDFAAFRRVLPSKLFEYGATDKPIVAGVAGYAAQFVRTHIDNSILFDPGDVMSLVRQLHETPYRTAHRPEFVARFGRKTIVHDLARQILRTAQQPTPTTEPALV